MPGSRSMHIQANAKGPDSQWDFGTFEKFVPIRRHFCSPLNALPWSTIEIAGGAGEVRW